MKDLPVLAYLLVGFYSLHGLAESPTTASTAQQDGHSLIAPESSSASISLIPIPNASTLFPNILVGGQPSIENIRAAHKAGYSTIINLRPRGEFEDWDEAALAEELGINYIVIPIADAGDLTPANAHHLDQALLETKNTPTIVHCASGNRVGALFALRAQMQGKDSTSALEIGKRAGLSKLTSVVKELLTQRLISRSYDPPGAMSRP